MRRLWEAAMTHLLGVAGAVVGAMGGGAALYAVVSRVSGRRRSLADEVLDRMESEKRRPEQGDAPPRDRTGGDDG
ncbi:MAG TPA: hypothetical protein VF984_13085 [Actinomycetota bacterium]